MATNDDFNNLNTDNPPPNSDSNNKTSTNSLDDNIPNGLFYDANTPDELFTSAGLFNYHDDKSEKKQPDKDQKEYGVHSIMTPDLVDPNGNSLGYSYSLTVLKNHDGEGEEIRKRLKDSENYKPWYDSYNSPEANPKEPTTSNIINWSKKSQFKERPYKYTDFVFCKNFNIVPNNYMVTLRRFPYPVFDNLKFPGMYNKDDPDNKNKSDKKIYTPLAQAVTYLDGEDNKISNIVKFTVSLPWEDLQATVHNIDYDALGSQNELGAGFDKFNKFASILTGQATFDNVRKGGQFIDPYENGPYSNKILGPINRIDKIKRRKPGLEFNHEIKLTFTYVNRPIDGVNSKAVMLDILANMLLLTYADAMFWGGMYRFRVNKGQYPFFAGAPGQQKFLKGDVAGFFGEVVNSLKGGITGALEGIMKNFFSGNIIDGLKSLASGAGKFAMAEVISKNKSLSTLQLPALLTGNPVGEWHLQVGNPFNPILNIGNLVCTDASFSFSDELGPDDFPMEMKVELTLQHGMPRDKAAVESMFNQGYGRIYALPDKLRNFMRVTGAGEDAPNTGADNATINDQKKAFNQVGTSSKETPVKQQKDSGKNNVPPSSPPPQWAVDFVNDVKKGLGIASDLISPSNKNNKK